MFDIELPAPLGAESLARIGRVLGDAGVGLEGGGMWSDVAHYLIADPDAALHAVREAGLGPAIVRPALLAELDADVPGALGRMMQQLSRDGVRLRAQYSDHENRKVLVLDDDPSGGDLADGDLVSRVGSPRHYSTPQHAPRCVAEAGSDPPRPGLQRLAMRTLEPRLIMRTSDSGHLRMATWRMAGRAGRER